MILPGAAVLAAVVGCLLQRTPRSGITLFVSVLTFLFVVETHFWLID